MRTLLCAIGRLENRYIREWVEWHKNIGFTNIVLYDNNYDREDDFNDVIGDYVADGFVILKDYRNRKDCQFAAYNECYEEYGKIYDWIAFFDCDEFLAIRNGRSVGEWLSSKYFKDFDMVHVNWMCYGDNGNVLYKEGEVADRFKNPILPYDFNRTYDFPENNHIKSIVRGGLQGMKFGPKCYSHSPEGIKEGRCCNNKGAICDSNSPFNAFDFTTAYIKHYLTKSTEEFAEKVIRGFPDEEAPDDPEWIRQRRKMMVERYFKCNEITQEKIDYFKLHLGVDYKVKNEEVKIYLLCYDKKEYDFEEDSVITPLQVGAHNRLGICNERDNTGKNISDLNYFFVENTGLYWIWQNIKTAKYKGQFQYRRWLEGINEKTDFHKIFSDYQIICAKPYNYPSNHIFIPKDTVMGGYEFSHCKEDLEIMGAIVKNRCPEYAEDWEKYIVNGENLYYSNGFVLPANEYDKYCAWLFDLLALWLVVNKIQDYNDLLIHVARNIGQRKYYRYQKSIETLPRSIYEYQTRIGGYLSERLFTLYVYHNFPKRYEVDYQKQEEGMYI